MLTDKKLPSLKDKLYGEKPEAPIKKEKKLKVDKKLGKKKVKK